METACAILSLYCIRQRALAHTLQSGLKFCVFEPSLLVWNPDEWNSVVGLTVLQALHCLVFVVSDILAKAPSNLHTDSYCCLFIYCHHAGWMVYSFLFMKMAPTVGFEPTSVSFEGSYLSIRLRGHFFGTKNFLDVLS